MYSKARERGILKLEPRPRAGAETRSELTQLTPQTSYERAPSSPHPSVDRLSVTWAEPTSMTSSAGNMFLPSDTTINNEVRFSPNPAEGSDDEDYSASLSAVIRRASVRRSRKGRARRPSSPFLQEEPRRDTVRRRSSVFTTSSGDTAISIDESGSQEQIFKNIHLHKEVLGSVKQQPLGMRRKLKLVYQAKTYIKRHEGQLQERLAQSKSTRDIYARFNIWTTTKWQQLKREAANTSNILIPWELRIKEIESHFGSVVASYFTFLRWLFWVNLVIAFILLVFVIVPEYLTANELQDGERKVNMEQKRRNATNLLTLWEFEGVLKWSPIFYGYYTNVERPEYRMPLAYFLTGLVVYIYSFVAILRKMAENSRMSKLSEKEDECVFSWKLFTGWDFMIGNTETASNRMASIILSFKEALLEEAEKKRDLRNWRIISFRALVNVCVLILLALSAFAVVSVVYRSDNNAKAHSWWRENETTIVVTGISITFPLIFELLGLMEHFHPRKQLRLQLARIMLLNLINLYSLIFALFSKIEGMSKDLDDLKPTLCMNATTMSENVINMNATLLSSTPQICIEEMVPCLPCNVIFALAVNSSLDRTINNKTNIKPVVYKTAPISASVANLTTEFVQFTSVPKSTYAIPENLLDLLESEYSTTENVILKELERLRNISRNENGENNNDSKEYDFDTSTTEDFSSLDIYTDLSSEQTYHLENKTTNITVTDNLLTNSMTETKDFETTAMNEDTTTGDTQDDFFTMTTHYELVTSTTEPPNIDTTGFNTLSTDEHTSTISESDSSNMTSTSSAVTLSTSQNTKPTTTKSIDFTTDQPTTTDQETSHVDLENKVRGVSCPNMTFNCTVKCDGKNITQIFSISNCNIVRQVCYVKKCHAVTTVSNNMVKANETNETTVNMVYRDKHNRKMYSLTKATKQRLLKLCWETMFGQELIKLTMMDLVFVLLGTLFTDFFRALFVRYFNKCWCWDLEKRFPEYGDFKIAENILHLINNQGMVWMGMFFSPGLVVLNVVKLMIMMYLRSWAVMTCNVPHEVVFRVSKSNNFYLALLLTMLFLCVLPVGYTIVWVKPSWHCGPFSEYERIYHILTTNIYQNLPKSLYFTLEYITSPAIVIPLLVLLILIIYYLTSLTNSLREANNDLKIQLRRERTEERRKMFQLADKRRRGGSSAMDNTPFARWKKALPSLPFNKSIDSDERKALHGDEGGVNLQTNKKKGNIFAKIVNMALDRKSTVEAITEIQTPTSNNGDDETDTDFHEILPKELLKIKDIEIPSKLTEPKKRSSVEFKTELDQIFREKQQKSTRITNTDNWHEEDVVLLKEDSDDKTKFKPIFVKCETKKHKLDRNQTSETSTQSKQSDSIISVIPVITISTTESDDEILQSSKTKHDKYKQRPKANFVQEEAATSKKTNSDLKSLRRQSSVDSVGEKKTVKEMKSDDGPKYQYSL